jgi:23S rRNA pseudouridine2605 synthase
VIGIVTDSRACPFARCHIQSHVPCPQARRRRPDHGVARAISKLGLGSRTQAAAWVAEGRVRVNGKRVADAEFPCASAWTGWKVSGLEASRVERVVGALNKPRGLVTTTRDERARHRLCLPARFRLALAGAGGPARQGQRRPAALQQRPGMGRARERAGGPDKRYHVQVDAIPRRGPRCRR